MDRCDNPSTRGDGGLSHKEDLMVYGECRILVRYVEQHSTTTFKRLVARFLTNSKVSVKRIRQQDGFARFDVIVKDPQAKCNLSRLERATNGCVKEGKPYNERKQIKAIRSVKVPGETAISSH